MRHKQKKHKLNRPADQQKALIRSLIQALFLAESGIVTTKAKAKALAEAMDKLLSKVARRKEAFNAIRDLMAVVYVKEASKKAMDYLKTTDKKFGFTRVTLLGQRSGDGAEMAKVELI